MFSKELKIKSNNRLRGSERKGLLATIRSYYPSFEAGLNEFLPQKDSLSCIKLTTHTNQLVLVYCVETKPIFFAIDNVFYPTVYTLWKFPNHIKTFTMHNAVLTKIISGADLMCPGVILPNTAPQGIHRWGTFHKGHVVAINTDINKAAVAVGTTAYSSQDMYMAGGKGRCVCVIHFIGDKLSEMCNQPMPDLGVPDFLMSPNEEIESKTENIIADINHEPEPQSNLDKTDSEVLLKDLTLEDSSTAEDMNELAKYCCLKAIYKNNKKLQLPILSSTFFRCYIVEACPSNMNLNIKKTTYKKVSAFLESMQAEDILKVETSKGVQTVVSINLKHPSIIGFCLKSGDTFEVKTVTDDKSEASGSSVSVIETFTITAAVFPLFAEAGFSRGDNLSVDKIRKYITDYVKGRNLQENLGKKFIKPNNVLIDICHTTEPVTWETMFNCVTRAMTPCYQMGEKDKVHKGKLEPVCMVVQTRSGNKKVTLVDNLEHYKINISDFAKKCQHGVGASTSVSRPPGKKSDQLLVQGNQILFIYNLLIEQYKIPKRQIKGLEFAPKKK